MRPYYVKPLDNTASILYGSFLAWTHFCSDKIAEHLSDTLSGMFALVNRWYG